MPEGLIEPAVDVLMEGAGIYFCIGGNRAFYVPAHDYVQVPPPQARRNILDQLRLGETSVTELVDRLDLPQPSVFKHLNVLREAGFVGSKVATQQRMYRLGFDRIGAADEWLEPNRVMWMRKLDALEQHFG